MLDISPKPVNSLRAKLHNLEGEEYTERFKKRCIYYDMKGGKHQPKDGMITIPGHGWIEMDFFEAVHFNGQYVPFSKNEVGETTNHKPLRIERLPLESELPKKYHSHADGLVFDTQKDLDAHLQINHHKWNPMRIDDLDKEMEQQKAVQKLQKNQDDRILSAIGALSETLKGLDTRLSRVEHKSKSVKRRKAKHDTTGDHRPS